MLNRGFISLITHYLWPERFLNPYCQIKITMDQNVFIIVGVILVGAPTFFMLRTAFSMIKNKRLN